MKRGLIRDVRLNARRAAAFYGYARLKENVTAPPLYVNIDLANICNYRCAMCPQSNPGGGVRRGAMGLDLFRKLIADVKEFAPIEQLSLFLAGEPLLNGNLEECVSIAGEELGIRPNIASNLSLLNASRAKGLIKAGLGSVVVDFAIDKAAFESMRRGGVWEETLERINLLLETRKKLGSRYPLIILKDISGCRGNRQDTGAAGLESLFPEGIDAFQSYRLHNWGGLVGEGDGGQGTGRYFPCSHLWFNMPIQYDGRVSACCRDAEGKLIMGDAKEKSLKEIWNDLPIVGLRKALIRKEYRDIELCSKCDRLWTGGYFGGNPIQVVKRLLKSRPGGFRLRYS